MNLEQSETRKSSAIHSTRILQGLTKTSFYLSKKDDGNKLLYDFYRQNKKSRPAFKVFVTMLNSILYNRMLSFVVSANVLVDMCKNDPNWSKDNRPQIDPKDVKRILNHLVECKLCTVETIEVSGKTLKLVTIKDELILDKLAFLELDPVKERISALKDVNDLPEDDLMDIEDSLDHDAYADMEFDKNYKKGDK